MTPDECEWSYESDPTDAWNTGCGALFQFSAGGPEENAFKFCCYCGGNLAVKEAPEPILKYRGGQAYGREKP